jgi:ornithine carbamoyltransferase
VIRHFLDVDDVDATELAEILALARHPDPPRLLAGQGAALLFEKPSARTRSSMELAVVQLGGHPVTMRNEEVGIDTRETAEDLARTMSAFHALICARVFRHTSLVRMAAASTVPVVNLLSEDAHPCQALADVLTLEDEFGSLPGRTAAWVGDGNNVCASFVLAAALVGLAVRVATPPGFELAKDVVERALALGGDVSVGSDPAAALEDADAVYTDVWTSMGQEDEADARRAAFSGFQVDEALMARTSPGAIFLHCLPAHRGEEVAAEVVDGPQSRVWPQAANRLHAQRGLLLWLMKRAS